MNNIRLTTPLQKDVENPAVELNPGNLKRWLNELPVNDISETIDRLDEAISAFNEVIVAPANRLKLLEVYLNAFHSIVHDYDEMRIAQLKVSSKQKQQVSEKILWLYIKLSHGYKIIVKNYVTNPESAKPPPHLLLSVFRGLELTVTSQICSYRLGLEVPHVTYLDLHQLYAFAEFYGLTDKPVKAASGYSKTPTIASYYALSMIFITLNPSEYEPYIIEVLFFALQPYSFHCPITQDPNFHENAYLFKINLNEKRYPSMVVNSEMCTTNEWTRYLNIDNFITEIQKWLTENESKKDNLLIEQELEMFQDVITRLKENQNECKDQFSENSASLVESAGEKVNQDESKDQLLENSAPLVENKGVNLVFGLGPLQGLLIAKSVNMGLSLSYNVSEWKVESQTENDCELTSHLDMVNDEMSLGDLAAIVGGGPGEPINLIKLAYIKRLQQRQQGELIVNLEHLDGDASPLIYQLVSNEDEKPDDTQANGIYLVSEKTGEEKTVLIINKRHFRENQQYLIKTRNNVSTVEATRLLTKTMCYAIFECRTINEETGNSNNGNPTNLAV